MAERKYSKMNIAIQKHQYEIKFDGEGSDDGLCLLDRPAAAAAGWLRCVLPLLCATTTGCTTGAGILDPRIPAPVVQPVVVMCLYI